MKLYYAPGGGMGHLTRGLALAHTLNWAKDELIFCSASPYAKELLSGYQHIYIPFYLAEDAIKLKIWLDQQLKTYGITEVYLDAFPSGIIGEWEDCSKSGIQFFYVARLLQWSKYVSLIKRAPLFERTFIMEPLHVEHFDFVKKQSKEIKPIKLIYPSLDQKAPTSLPENSWMIVHSGSEDEVWALLDMAEDLAKGKGLEPHFCLMVKQAVSPLPERCFLMDDNYAWQYFDQVDRIFTACGFNLMQQTLPFRHKHDFLPFLRRYDDQFARAKLHIGEEILLVSG